MSKYSKKKKGDEVTRITGFPNLYTGLSNVGEINSNTTGTSDDTITSSVKPVEKEDATIEAEKGEVLLKYDLGGIYRITGKKHKNGGSPLAVQPGSFIFSDKPELAINKEEKEVFKFSLGGTHKAKNNTPAKVLLREVDPKEYNKLVSILQDPHSDKIAKETAMLMLGKYQQKVGQVAAIQELKKNAQLPSFAVLPEQNQAQDFAEDNQEMFAEGGLVKFPYGGGFKGAKYQGKQYNAPEGLTPQSFYSNPWVIEQLKADQTFPKAVDDGIWGIEHQRVYEKGLKEGKIPPMTNPNDIGRFNSNVDSSANLDVPPAPSAQPNPMLGRKVGDMIGRISGFNGPINPTTDNTLGIHRDHVDAPHVVGSAPIGSQSGAPNIDERPWQGYDFKMNSAEKLSIAAPFLTALTMPSFYDDLNLANTTDLRFDRLDNEQEVADMNQRASTETRAAYQNMPASIARQVAAGVNAQTTQAEGQSDANIRNANSQIGNQEVQSNAQRRDNVYQFNLGQMKEVGRNNKLTRQRRAYELANAASQSMNAGFMVNRNLEQLSNAATAAALPYVTTEKDANGQDVIRTDANGNQYKQQGVPFGFNDRRRPIFNKNFGSLDTFGVLGKMNSGSADATSEILKLAMEQARAGNYDATGNLSRLLYTLTNKNTQAAYSDPRMALLQNMMSAMTVPGIAQ